MTFLETMKNRYTTKMYDPSKKIDANEIEHLKSILQLSASSINSQPWHFTIVNDEIVKTELAEHSIFNKDRVLNASHLVIFSVWDDIKQYEELIEKNLSEGSIGYYKQFIQPKGDEQIKLWLSHQVYVSLGFFLSACATMKIDATPMEGIVNSEYRRIAGLKEYQPLFAVAIGYRDSEDFNQPSKNPKFRLNTTHIFKEI